LRYQFPLWVWLLKPLGLNCFYKATAGNGKKLLQIVDIEEHLGNQYWADCSRQ
jgi:hypothetical protein